MTAWSSPAKLAGSRGRVALEEQGREPHARRPALGTPQQQLDVVGVTATSSAASMAAASAASKARSRDRIS